MHKLRTTVHTPWAKTPLLRLLNPTTRATPLLKHPLPQISRPQATMPTSTFVNCAPRSSLSTHQPAFARPSPQGLRTFPALAHQTLRLRASRAVLRAATSDLVRPSRRRSRPKRTIWICSAWVSAEPPARALTRNTARLLDRPPWHTGRYVERFHHPFVFVLCLYVAVSLSWHLSTFRREALNDE